jgi:hypothetical protein
MGTILLVLSAICLFVKAFNARVRVPGDPDLGWLGVAFLVLSMLLR